MTDFFWAKVDRTEAAGCWLWTASLQTSGYGACYIDRKQLRAHRIAYERLVGPIPEGFHLHHECGVRRCVNPSHLLVITAAEHAAIHARRPDRCPSDHPYDEVNTYVTRRGIRQCRACDRERKAAAYRLAQSCKANKEKVTSDA